MVVTLVTVVTATEHDGNGVVSYSTADISGQTEVVTRSSQVVTDDN